MGERTTENSSTIIQEVGEQGTEDRRSDRSGSSTDSTTKRGTRGTDTTGDRGDTRKGTEEKKDVSRLSSIDEKEQKRLERNAKRRAKYQEQKANGTLKQAKPKKVNKPKKKENELDTSQINIIIKTLSSLVAARPGYEHWLLSDAEIESITTPLGKMLAESDVFNKIGEHSNQIALITACITVFMPRIIVTTTLLKEKKKNERKPKQQPTSRSENKVIDIDKRNDRGATPNSQNDSQHTNWLDSIVN